jgi:6-phospho-beta-glucosidase
VRSIGLCNGPIGYQMAIARDMGLDNPFEVQLDYLGLNHLAWIRGAHVDGRDVWPQVFEGALQRARERADSFLPAEVMERLGVICTSYLRYYYRTQDVLRAQARGGPSRAEQVIEIEKALLAQYADATLDRMPTELMQRGGAYYSTVATQLIEALVLNLDQVHIVNTRQAGAVPDCPPEWVMELPCRIDATGPHPVPTNPLPLFANGLLRAVKAYELLAAQAAVSGSRTAALQALLVHPLGPDADQALEVLEDLLNVHRAHLGRFVEAGFQEPGSGGRQ